MTKLIASLAALAIVAVALPAMACPFKDQTTAQSAPVVTSDASTTQAPPMTPVPPTDKKTPTSTKTGS